MDFSGLAADQTWRPTEQPGGAITSAAITEFKISDSTTVTCDSNEGFWAEVQSWLIPQFAGDIYGAVNAPMLIPM